LKSFFAQETRWCYLRVLCMESVEKKLLICQGLNFIPHFLFLFLVSLNLEQDLRNARLSRIMSASDSESESETDSERAELQSNLGKTATQFEKSLAFMDELIGGLQDVYGKLASIETTDMPVQKDMWKGKYEVRKTIPELSVKEGDLLTFKQLVARIISWIEAEEMEEDGGIRGTERFREVFALKKKVVKFPEVLGRLKKVVK